MSDEWMDQLYSGDVLYGSGNGDEPAAATTLVAPSPEKDFPAGGDDTPSGGEQSHTEANAGRPPHAVSRAETAQDHQPESPSADTAKLPTAENHSNSIESTDTPENPGEPDAKEKAGRLAALKAKTEKLKEKADSFKERTDKTKEKAGQKTTAVTERVRPARDVVAASLANKKWGFLWAAGASWLIGPQTLVAAWDRVVITFGQDQLASGDEPMGWGLLHGPGRWFRDTVGAHWEGDTVLRLLVCAVIGVAPLLLSAAYRERPYETKRGAAFLGLALAVYVTGISYLGWPSIPASAWGQAPNWNDFYVVGLCSAAWYCTVWAKGKEAGFLRFLLLIPLASVVSGIVLYSPGAAF